MMDDDDDDDEGGYEFHSTNSYCARMPYFQKHPYRGIGGVFAACFEGYWWVLVGIGGYWQPPADRERNSDDNGDIRKSQDYTGKHSETCIQPENVDMANQIEKT